MKSIIHWSFTFALLSVVGLLLLFFGLQILSFIWLSHFMLSDGLVVAYAGLVTAFLMLIASYLIAWQLGNCQLLGSWRFDKRWFVFGLVAWVVFALIAEWNAYYFKQSPMDFLDGLVTDESLIALFVLIVVVAPIYEEIVFRGLIFELLLKARYPKSKYYRVLAAILGSSLVFALVHLQYNWFGFLAIFVLAMILAWIKLYTNSILLPIIIHMINNSVAMASYWWGLS